VRNLPSQLSTLLPGRAGDGIHPSRTIGAHLNEIVVPQHFQLHRHRRLTDAELAGNHLDDRSR